MVDRDWTFEQAFAAQQDFEEKHPGAIRGPLWKWQTLWDLEIVRERFQTERDHRAILKGMHLCLLDDLPVPDWLSQAFRNAYQRGHNGHLKSWDDVFGRPPTRNRVQRQVRRLARMPEVWKAIAEASKTEPKSDELFERVGKELGVGGKTIVKQIWARRPSHIK